MVRAVVAMSATLLISVDNARNLLGKTTTMCLMTMTMEFMRRKMLLVSWATTCSRLSGSDKTQWKRQEKKM